MVVNSVRTVPGPTSSGWWTFFSTYPFTFENYYNAWTGNGTGAPLSGFLLNTFVITIPAVILPISLALIAAYAFAWIDFKGRSLLFVAVFATADRPDPGGADPAEHHVRRRGDWASRSGRSGSPTPSSVCRWRSSCCTTS